MSAITLFNNSKELPGEVSGKLTVSENSVAGVTIASEANPRIEQMDVDQIGRIVTAITMKAAVRLGSRARDLQDQQMINSEINRDLVLKFSTKTEQEIMMALENGLDGLYLRKPDDPIIFNPSNFAQWVRAFETQTKRPVMAKISSMAAPSEQEWTAPESEKLKMSHEFFLGIMRRVLDGEVFEDWGNRVYDFLDKIGFMLVAPADKWKAIDMAKLKLIAEAREIKDAIAQRTAVQKAMEMIGKEGDQPTPQEAIISAAKRILVSQKLNAYKTMPEDEQTMLLESIADRVEYMCIELKEPEQYSPDEE